MMLLTGVGLLAILVLIVANHRTSGKRPMPLVPTFRPDQVVNSIGIELKLIPAGEFRMGWTGGGGLTESERPVHRVRITRPFYLGVYEVTQAEYWQVMGTNPSWFSAKGGGKDKIVGSPDTSRYPVEQVSWHEAVNFCNKLSEREGLKPCYRPDGGSIPDGDGYRLPTEAEWEYGCRAGTTTLFSFGDKISSAEANFEGTGTDNFYAVVKGKKLERTAQVGSYRPNQFGFYDMHGNVDEWCSDWYGMTYYAKSPTDDPPGDSGPGIQGTPRRELEIRWEVVSVRLPPRPANRRSGPIPRASAWPVALLGREFRKMFAFSDFHYCAKSTRAVTHPPPDDIPRPGLAGEPWWRSGAREGRIRRGPGGGGEAGG